MIVWLLLAVGTASPQQLIAQVQAAYRDGGDLEATFTHVYIDKLRGKKRVETGKLWAKRDGRVRWSYLDPVPKDFVFTGERAFFYEPDNAQVTVFEQFKDSPLFEALRFLWGQGSLSEVFAIKPCNQHCDLGTPGETVIELWPKKEIPSVDHSVVVVDPKILRILRSVVFDPLGNRTEYHFRDVKLGAKVPAAMFKFDIPEGVNILKASADESGK